MSQEKTFHVISGTHWDREWRFTAEQSLLRLAELVDELLQIMEQNTDYTCFLLDGGTVVIEDYLAVRPENRERLTTLMQAGRIQTVMWYTLPEMSTVAPESLIRNLLFGKQMADIYGGATNAGYTATSYGQISQLAQIYAGFGMKSALSYRGTNRHQVPPICHLESPDGTRIYHIRCFDEVTRTNWFFFPHYKLVLGKHPRDLSTQWKSSDWPVHMADAGLYESAFQMKNESMDFNKDPEAIREAIRMLAKQTEPQIINDQLLALDMEDNAVPYSRLPELIGACNAAQDDYVIKQSGIDDYVDACLDGLDPENVPVQKGEMRYTLVEAGFNGLLGATHSSRMDLKTLNDLAERELIQVAEPLASISSAYGGDYEGQLLKRAWLYLLKNHAHDSICGAAISQAHEDNPFRFRATTSIALECTRKASEQLWERMDTASSFEEGDITLTFFNSLPYERKRIESVVVDTPRPDFGSFKVETCTGVGPIVEGFDPDSLLTFQYFDLVDQEGNKVPYTLLEREDIDMEIERKLDANAAVYDLLRNRLLVEVTLPPMGWTTLALRPRLREYEPEPKPNGERALIAKQNGCLENEHLLVKVNQNGTLDATDKATGKVIKGLHLFQDDASTGNAHKHDGVLRNLTVNSACESAHLSLLENNAMRATWQIDFELPVPECALGKDRSKQKVPLSISTKVSLAKGSRRLEFETTLNNRAKDHRVRLLFPTGVKTDVAHADSAFDVVSRGILWNDTKDNMEPHHPYQPMKRFVSLSDDNSGFSFIGKGIGEYEVIDDAERTLAVTLLRTTRVSMKANRGTNTPEELHRSNGHQLLGEHTLSYSIVLHESDWFSDHIHQEADDFRTPVRVLQGVPKAGELDANHSLFTLSDDDSIQLAALYQSEDGATILRLWNCSSKPVQSELHFGRSIKTAEIIAMDESPTGDSVKVDDQSIALSFRQSQILTIRITF